MIKQSVSACKKKNDMKRYDKFEKIEGEDLTEGRFSKKTRSYFR